MNVIWWIFLPSVYLLIAAFIQRMAKKAQEDDQMASEELDREDTQ